MFRTTMLRAVAVLAAVTLAGCAGGSAPTPIIVYVTPEPTAVGLPAPVESTVPEPVAEPSEAAPTSAPQMTPAPVAVATPKPTAKPTPRPTPKVTYAKLSDRAWAKLVKSPDRYMDDGFVVWGCIWQFDAATGDDAFLAQASNKKRTWWWSDGENASFIGNASRLADFVEDDVVLMKVISEGSYSYDTQAGGNTTVPQFRIVSISRKGSC